MFLDIAGVEKQAKEEMEFLESEITVTKAVGDDLLKIIDCLDHVLIDWQPFAVSLKGRNFDGEIFERLNPNRLKERLIKEKI